MENFKVKKKEEFNSSTKVMTTKVQVLVMNRNIPIISTIAEYELRDGKVKVLASKCDNSPQFEQKQ